MWQIQKYTKTGKRNQDEGLQCQDCIAYMEKDEFQVIALADGTGNSDYARMGANQSCQVLAKLLAEHFDELYDMDQSLVQFHVITNVKSELYELCREHHIDVDSLHSTLMAVAVDHKENRFMAVHLGDGVIRMRREKKMTIISYPENGSNRSQTYLTSENKAGRHIRVLQGVMENAIEFLLTSDGWEENTVGKNDFDKEEMLRLAEENTYDDDVSFIALQQE